MGQKGKSRKNSKKFRRDSDDQQQPKWVIDINDCLQEGSEIDLGRSWTIYRVPGNMREVYRKVYVPKLISIGPFHYGEKRYNSMDSHKMRYLLRLLGGKYTINGQLSEDIFVAEPQDCKTIVLEDLVHAMQDLEQSTRECYSEVFDWIGIDDFVKMMVVDGCFIIELLRLYYKFDREIIVEDPIFTTRWMLRSLQRDLLMLENQLPFFVLEKLYNLTRRNQEPSLFQLIITFFNPLFPRQYDLLENLNPEEKFDHMLDVFRSTFLSSIKVSSWENLEIPENLPFVQERQLIHCTTELKETGLKFKKRENVHDLLDISYENGTLEVPPLYIDDNTVRLFLNFLAYEQCDEEAEPFFTNYFMFFDSLINSPKDVQILHQNGIINHVLGTEKDVANLFNKICREIVCDLDECYLSKQMTDINAYYKAYHANKWRVWWTSLIRDYFSSPWTLISLLAAITLLLLSFIEAFYAVYESHK